MFYRFISICEQLYEIRGQLCNGPSHLSEIIIAKRSNSLQPKGGTAGNPICEYAVRIKVNFVRVASKYVFTCENALLLFYRYVNAVDPTISLT